MQLVSNEGHAHFIYGDREEGLRAFLHRAAQDGHAPAMYQYALQCGDPHERLRWIRRAAGAGYARAINALARTEAGCRHAEPLQEPETRVVAFRLSTPGGSSGSSRFADLRR